MIPSIWLALATPSLAASLPEVAVLGVHVEGVDVDEAFDASTRIAEALEATGKMVAVRPEDLGARLSGREELVIEEMALANGRALLEEGRLLYERAEPDSAIPLLEEAVAALQGGIGATGETRDLIEAELTLGLAQVGMGEEFKARAAFQQVVVLDPGRELDPMRYPPDVVELYANVRQSVLDQGMGTLVVRADQDPEARVVVDGSPQGSPPVELEVPLGEHHVFVTGDGGKRFYGEVTVAEGGAMLPVVLQAGSIAPPAQDEAGRQSQTEALYTALGRYAETPLLLLAGETSDDKVAVLIYSSRSGSFSQAMTAPAGDDPVQSIVDLIPVMGSYVTEAGDIRGDRVALYAPGLDVGDNAALARLLLDPGEQVRVVIQEGESSGNAKWLILAGAGAVALGGAGVATWAVVNSGSSGDPTDAGTITFGPIP